MALCLEQDPQPTTETADDPQELALPGDAAGRRFRMFGAGDDLAAAAVVVVVVAVAGNVAVNAAATAASDNGGGKEVLETH
eukprot:CAMPEP_0172360204 /NCGR_PEP_ID=MMETSP1060-20121228/4278_1 /TAXON_ID=37318 /ORGANISM="Pseudo-nitzschia pungens, Strain cf. cingulata" /LENGTH=80 /DNA_ID=CAMNT_0013082141 /DNA_START=130 /DNA_END=372 /DNA_ORIENTATION=+